MAGMATVTVLFTDLVDSTRLVGAHGPAVADELRRQHLTALRSAVASHGGTEIKTTGDGLMVVFTSALDAVAAARAMQIAVDGLRRRDDRTPAVRVGISTGEASPEDGDWYGVPVIEAARLCAAAEGGQILASGLVGLLARGHGGEAFVPLGARVLKGFEHPVDVLEVPWTAAPASIPPLTPAAAAAADGPIVGREDELELARLAWKRASSGERRLLLLAGEPGVGKTRLAAELARVAHDEGALVLWGRADEELAEGYQPFDEALRAWASTADDAALARTLRPEALRLVPEFAARVPADRRPAADREVERTRFFDDVVSTLLNLASDTPVVLVLDDVHWAPPGALLLLRYLARDQRPGGLLVVVTYRDTEVGRHHPLAALLADLRRQPGVDRISLDGLDTDAVEAFVRAIAAEPLHDALVPAARALQGETEGNPFFLGQLLRHLAESGVVRLEGGVWQGTIDTADLPEGVREVVGRRLSTLSDAANDTLLVAAVVGAEFDCGVVEQLLERDDVLDALEEAVAARLLREVPTHAGRYAFVHAIVRHTLLGELSSVRRARLHHRIAAALMQRSAPPPALVVHHLLAAGHLADPPLVVSWALDAARDSVDRLAFEQALELVVRAEELIDSYPEPDRALRAALRVEQAGLHVFVGSHAEGKQVASLAAADARAAGEWVLLREAVETRAGYPIAGVPDPETDALLDELLAMDLPPDERSRVLASQALNVLVTRADGRAARRLVREAVDLATTSGVDVSWPLTVQCFAEQGDADLPAQAVTYDALAAFPFTGARYMRRRVGANFTAPDTLFRHRSITALQSGHRDRFDADVEAFRQWCDATGYRLGEFILDMWAGMTALLDGRLEDASESGDRILRYAESRDDPNALHSWAALQFTLHRERGTLAELAPLWRDALESAPDLVILRACSALTSLEGLGDRSDAAALLDDFVDDPDRILPTNLLRPAMLAYLTELAVALRHEQAARLLRDALLPYSGQVLIIAWGVACLGAADRYLAMLERLLRIGDPSGRFDAAAALEERIAAPALVAQTQRARQAPPGVSAT